MCTQNAHLSTSGCINLQCTALNQSNAWFFSSWESGCIYITYRITSDHLMLLICPRCYCHHHYRCKQTTPKRHSWAMNPSAKISKTSTYVMYSFNWTLIGVHKNDFISFQSKQSFFVCIKNWFAQPFWEFNRKLLAHFFNVPNWIGFPYCFYWIVYKMRDFLCM